MKKPSELVKQVYHEHIARFGEPAQSIRYDNPPNNDEEKYPSFIDVMVWPPDEEVNITTFATIGMSEKPMTDANHRAELHFSVEGELDGKLIGEITMFMANVSLYPFMNSTYFDWWHILPNINIVPGFPSVDSLLLHPAFVEEGWDLICVLDTHVKIINLVPITKEEHKISKENGINKLLDYLYENNISYFKRR